MKKITMQQIADHLGVSKFVVSKALSGKGGVNEVTRNRVIQAASQLGYFAQKNAYIKNQALPQQTAPTPGKQSVIVLMPNIRFQTKDSLYWGKILEGISTELESRGFGMVIVSDSRMDQFIHVLNPDGILGMIGVGQIDSALLLEVHRLGISMVLVDHEDALIPTDTIFANNGDSMMRLCNHLIGLGHKELYFLSNLSFSRSFRDRWTGFREAMELNGLKTQPANDPLLWLEGIDTGGYREELAGWLEMKKREQMLPTALVCANDSIAVQTISILQELGVSVPEQISVTGFDNIDDAYHSNPALTTVNVPKEAIGRRAVKKLMERIEHPDFKIEKVLVTAELVHRGSTAVPKK
ncbi:MULTISPECIES: LacI family DNA-binding transcriptional regulator [Paenibacillus]|uniref:LacI family DNA-binding transcriptional regulator n=1 Tax=Paenibacillus TaxID=44249 RepID=UPI002FDF5F0C